MDKQRKPDSMNSIVFSGSPPPSLPKPAPEPEVRRDSLGRRITDKQLAALRRNQYAPGESGNPGGRLRGRGLQEGVISLMKRGKLKPSDTIADFLNLLGDMD